MDCSRVSVVLVLVVACARATKDLRHVPASIVGEEEAAVTGELERPVTVRCHAYGVPPPAIYWYSSNGDLITSSKLYEAHGQKLLIRRLSLETLGQYVCQAYNGECCKPATWQVTVVAYRPSDDFMPDNPYLLPSDESKTLWTNTELELEDTDPCTLPPEPISNCIYSSVMWYYNVRQDQCYQFTQGECGGNGNEFDTHDLCEVRCKKQPAVILSTTTMQGTFEKSFSTETEATTTGSSEDSSSTVNTEATDNTKDGITEDISKTETSSMEVTENAESGSTKSNETGSSESSETGSTEPTKTNETNDTEQEMTTETGRTKSTQTDETGTPEATEVYTDSTESAVLDQTTSDVSGSTVTTKETQRTSFETDNLYGWCPDGKTPAHGHDHEGCCLQDAFGCCPDNYKPANGTHLESCGCQNSRFGCCPDNVTIATGPDYKGCGCQYTQHGCCPDRHSKATGPDFKGCLCHTYQFGCCPNGVTIASGPNGQGCYCQQSKFGCCGDEQTHAKGPNKEGCDCATSKHGCCLDGTTEATGTHFQGCSDVPENKQSACYLKFERGECRNYSVNWYYDTEYGGCSRFWYGGCEGNGNRFSSKEDCEDTCVSPPHKDACKLPPVKGACLGYIVNWYYDDKRDTCTNFVYSGCLGNNNNFETQELCQAQCEPERTLDQCDLAIERGSCTGNYLRWGFNKKTWCCEEFSWGGCEGNANRFSTEAACMLRCNPPGKLQPECLEPQDVGACNDTEALWSFSQSENRCVPFYFTGCEGNRNKFQTKEDCQKFCPSAYVPELCTLPAAIGDCSDYTEKWYFDTKNQTCRQFYYGGCGGNGNKFNTERECATRCSPQPTTTAGPPAPTTIAPHADSNQPDICQLTKLSGPCDGSVMSWFYDASSDSCSQFTYGGCGGNENRFETREECENRCKTGLDPSSLTPETTTVKIDNKIEEKLAKECVISPVLEECSRETVGEVWFYDKATNACAAHENLETGEECRTTGVFYSQEACERSCGVFRNIEISQAPYANLEMEPQVAAAEGGKATLRCIFHGNPSPKITWRFGEITINSDVDRYRLLSDGALEIVSLRRNDSGVYSCVAKNELSSEQQEVTLQVNDPVLVAARIAGETGANITGELDQPVSVRCLAYGNPVPSVYWYRGKGGSMVPFSSALYETRGLDLLIRNLTLETLGEYECQAYNGLGRPATWQVTVLACQPPNDSSSGNPFLVPRVERGAAVGVTPRAPTTDTTNITSKTPKPELEHLPFTVPVQTKLLPASTTVSTGAQLSLPCEVDGFPEPEVHWTKDSVVLVATERIWLSGSRLTIPRALVIDSGVYGCHAANAYSSHASTVQITVQEVYIPAKCVDNPLFANCGLIVQTNFCRHKYYGRFCCKSCVVAGQLDASEAEAQAKRDK